MKTTHIAMAAASVAALIAGSALAQTVTTPSAQNHTPRHAGADADGDGRISQAEFVQRRVARLSAVDANADGTVTVEETHAGRQARRAERTARRFDRLDADKDGAISRAEFDMPRVAPAGRADGARPGHGPRREGMGARARQGHGGPEAHRAGRAPGARGPVVIADARTRAVEAFVRLDADRDGYLTQAERRASRTGHRAARKNAPTQASPLAPASE